MMCEIYRFSPFFRAPLINSSPRRKPGSRFLKDMDSGFRRNEGIGINQSLLSCLRIYESRLVFKGSLIISTVSFLISAVSFRAKARNLVSATSSVPSFCRIASQRSVNHFTRSDIVIRASSACTFIRNLYCPIRNLVHLLVRPFSLREKARMRERKYTFTRSSNPLPMGEGL